MAAVRNVHSNEVGGGSFAYSFLRETGRSSVWTDMFELDCFESKRLEERWEEKTGELLTKALPL